MFKKIFLFCCVLLALIVSSCSTVKVTAREQSGKINVSVSPSQPVSVTVESNGSFNPAIGAGDVNQVTPDSNVP